MAFEAGVITVTTREPDRQDVGYGMVVRAPGEAIDDLAVDQASSHRDEPVRGRGISSICMH